MAYEYFNQLDKLDLPVLEALFDKISGLIFSKKKNVSSETQKGLDFFNSIKGSVSREIDEKEELAAALNRRYSPITLFLPSRLAW